MVPLEEALRQFWLPGLHEVKGRTTIGLARWIESKNFVFSSITSATEFNLKSLEPEKTLSALAHDSSRMACAAFESLFSISDYRRLPRSCAWVNITAYYGAFFAAHSFLRMCGIICFQIESSQKSALEKVAVTFGESISTFESGFYIGNYNYKNGELSLKKSPASSKGSHAILWELFEETLRNYSNALIEKSALFNDSALFLDSIAEALCKSGLKGTWLTSMRNTVNYKHDLGAWFPYKSLQVNRRELVGIVTKWQNHPQKLALSYNGKALAEHVAVSSIIVSLCYLVVNDMRAIAGPRSYHSYSTLALIKLASQVA
jgi:hypothetical protein